jgi:hypothetical protein
VDTKNNALGSSGTFAGGDPTPLSIRVWYHLVGTYDGSFTNFYINGTKVGTGTQAISGRISDTPAFFYFGYPASESFNWMDGMIDEVRLYRKALNDAEVKALYDSYNPK